MLTRTQLRDEREQQLERSLKRKAPATGENLRSGYFTNWFALLLGNRRCLWQKIEYMHSQNIDYAAIKDRLKSLQPKNRAETRYAQLAQLREELLNARKRGVSFNTLSAELKAAGIKISSGALAKYLSRRSSNSATKRTTTAAKPNHVPEPHGQVKTGT
jgi:hypothetical protein